MDILSSFPKPLLGDLISGRWLPVIGSGFSCNAIVPGESSMPLWDDLGKVLGQELADHSFSTPLEVMSAYEHEFCRPRLVERLRELLLVNDAQPGAAHREFCALPFDVVCTTNLEFLLEQQYMLSGLYCQPVIDEEQLAISRDKRAVTLLKLHGDLHHPNRMVVTEDDYDRFLRQFPLMATYLSSLLITRTLVLVGYSLSDPDFRQLWRTISDRLGRARRDAYVLLLKPHRFDIARYARRGVKVIEIPDTGSGYGASLATVFRALSNYWTEHGVAPDDISDERVVRELAVPARSPSRICFFSVPNDLQSFYRNEIFQIADDCGLVPMTVEDIVTEGDNLGAKVRSLIARSHAVVIDASNPFSIQDLSMARALRKGRRTLVILPAGRPISRELKGITRIRRPDRIRSESSEFLGELGSWLSGIGAKATEKRTGEPARLLNMGEYRAAVVSAMTSLEATVRRVVANRRGMLSGRMSLGYLMRQGVIEELFGPKHMDRLDKWRRIRNRTVHTTEAVEKGVAAEIVHGVSMVIQELTEKDITHM